jgi:hypothetical protein
MRKLKKFSPALLIGLLLAGCVSTNVSRLTPRTVPRNSENLYPVEVELDSSQQSLRWETLKPRIIVNATQEFPMHRTPLMTNRWEGLISVPPGVNHVEYRIKFDFYYNAWGVPPQEDSFLSKVYKLDIADGMGNGAAVGDGVIHIGR